MQMEFKIYVVVGESGHWECCGSAPATTFPLGG